jgi:hypothetical protein
MITTVTVAIGAAVLVLVGIPLLAWWVGGRRSWGRLAPPDDPYLSLAMSRRHGLQPLEHAVVEGAATWGRELHDDRLRAAAVELAERHVRATGGRRQPSPWLVIPFAGWGAAIVGYDVFRVAQGEWSHANWLILGFWSYVAFLGWRWQTGPERAIRLNSPPSLAVD